MSDNFKSPINNLAFVKEVAKYFMDFLETDFHKRRKPKRSISFRNKQNLFTGLNLKKYPLFQLWIWRLISNNFPDNSRLIKRGSYTTKVPSELKDLIGMGLSRINESNLNALREKIQQEFEKSFETNSKDYEMTLNKALDFTAKVIEEDLVGPIWSWLEIPFKQQRIMDEDNLLMLKTELISVIMEKLESPFSEIIKQRITGGENARLSLEIINLEEIKAIIEQFFENMSVADLFFDLFELEKNRNLLDKQELYLYLFDIGYDDDKYPIFYVPVSLIKNTEGFDIQIDSQIYINKKALEFIVEQYNDKTEKVGKLKTISERIIYLAQHQEDFYVVVQSILDEICNYFNVSKTLNISQQEYQTVKSPYVSLSNSCYLCLFDKSDEALVNDYEEILQRLENEEDEIAKRFNGLINDFIHTEPKQYKREIDGAWDELSTEDKLVTQCPIPLNSEQRQILHALKQEGCKYITVAGPPGTGKSHTITAIAFDCILHRKSVLILSDKKEALDVVEDKIKETMNTVRLDQGFQNPLLRLGKSGNTYSQILSINSMDAINMQYTAVRNRYSSLLDDILKSINSLKEDLEAEILSYSNISIKEIQEYIKHEGDIQNSPDALMANELKESSNVKDNLIQYRQVADHIKLTWESIRPEFFSLISFEHRDNPSIKDFDLFLSLIHTLLDDITKCRNLYPEGLEKLNYFESIREENLEYLRTFITNVESLRSAHFGFLFHPFKIINLNKEFLKTFVYVHSLKPHKDWHDLQNVYNSLNYFYHRKKQYPVSLVNLLEKLDLIFVVHRLCTHPSLMEELKKIASLKDEFNTLFTLARKYPITVGFNEYESNRLSNLLENSITLLSEQEFAKIVRYIELHHKLTHSFRRLPDIQYPVQKKKIENLVTLYMTYLMDGRVIDFYNDNRATARVLSRIIRNKQKFPRNEFDKLREAFPCIIAGIRDYAEYIPLEPELFDLVIIDEASQVSIAQALPSFLRAKNVLILGDRKQFSNVKSAQARTDTNKGHLNRLHEIFRQTVSREEVKLERVKKFDIKTSVLDFFEYIHNFDIMLRKYFRGYKEIISYSKKYFYDNQLQIMKIRGKPIGDVLKFTFLSHDGRKELIENTNTIEIEFIIKELQELKENKSSLSVGIITPHTNQQKLLMEGVSKLIDRDFYFEDLKLKIMTFDTCQGEERDIIFYSMVANPSSDQLWGVFIKDLSAINMEDDSVIKVQRLNVGFSRARECMHFVLSKPIEQFNGSIREAFQFYWQEKLNAEKEPLPGETDANSPMESKVLHWLTQTDYWKSNISSGNLTLKPQFPIGVYLHDLDKTYSHPAYKVDFLLITKDQSGKEKKIIIEYDGFEEHFTNLDRVNEFTYQHYLKKDDIYREKVLEDYGYKFLRINRFNVGDDPVQTLNNRLKQLIRSVDFRNPLLEDIHETIEGLQNGEMKECAKCGKILPLEDFYDSDLITGYGRFCRKCKKK